MSVSVSEETAPEDDAPAVPATRRPAAADLLTTTDHKRIGTAYIWTSLLFLLVGAVAALVIRSELFTPKLQILDADTSDQLYTLHAVVMVFLFLLPVWIGFATYLVPLQVGARRQALPRLHAFAYWLYLAGGLICVGSYLVDGGPFAGRFLLFFDDTSTAGGGRASNLWILGIGAVAVAAILASASLITTIVKYRAPGMTALRIPPFSWSVLVGSTVILLATPVFVAGLILLYVDLNHGGTVFTTSYAGRVLWQHTLWIYGRPEIYALLVFGLGVLAEVLAVHGRNRVIAYKPLLVALAGVGVLSFTVWAYDANGLRAGLAPHLSPVASLMFVPVVVVVLISLGTLARGRPRITAALLHAIGVVLVLLIGAAAAISAAIVDVRGGTEWQGSQAHVVLFASALLAVLAAFYHWAPKLWGRHLSEGLGILSFLALLVGAVVAFAPGYLGLRDQSRVLGQNSDLDRFTSWNRVAAIGSYVLVAGILLFLVNLLVSVVGRKGAPAENDPWNGHSLEWHASSPPVAHNFDTIPEIRSEQPVLDLHAVREEVSV